MTYKHQTHIVPYRAVMMYDLVADVERYPEFVPHCAGLRVLKRDHEGGFDTIFAEMIVQYRAFRERFKCYVTLDPKEKIIRVRYAEGPIRKLNNVWRFVDLEEGGSEVDFEIEFEFRSFLFQHMGNAVFDKAFAYMSDAFVKRAEEIYEDQTDKSTKTGNVHEDQT